MSIYVHAHAQRSATYITRIYQYKTQCYITFALLIDLYINYLLLQAAPQTRCKVTFGVRKKTPSAILVIVVL